MKHINMPKLSFLITSIAISLLIILFAASSLHVSATGKYSFNENGQTYGCDVFGTEGEPTDSPDLIQAIGEEGVLGYVYSSDFGLLPKTPQEAIAQNFIGDKIIPLYNKDGKTIIGSFKITTRTNLPSTNQSK